MQDLKLIKATGADIEQVAQLAHIIWNQHYPEIIGQQQVDYMLNLMYSHHSLQEQLAKKGHTFYLVNVNGSSIGFISVNETSKGEWFLNKFYIDQTRAAKGLGTQGFEILKTLLSPKKITLTVNRSNFKSINFYFKNGFKISEVADFDIGNGYAMNDFVMQWKDGKM